MKLFKIGLMKMAKKIAVKSKSSNKYYYIWLGDNGHIAIDRESQAILDISKLKGVEEKIFMVYNTLRNRDAEIKSLKFRLRDLYHSLNLDNSHSLRSKRRSDKYRDEAIERINSGNIYLTLYRYIFDSTIDKLYITPEMNTLGRITIRSARAIIDIMRNYMSCGFESEGYKSLGLPLFINLKIVPNDHEPNIITNVEYRYIELTRNNYMKYPCYEYTFIINRNWYYKYYLKNVKYKDNYVLKKEVEGKTKIYYVISESSGYKLKVKKISTVRN